jgi:hypothetical protein
MTVNASNPRTVILQKRCPKCGRSTEVESVNQADTYHPPVAQTFGSVSGGLSRRH